MKRASQFDKIAQSFADKLTPEQVIALYQVVDPLTDAERAEFSKLSNDDLARELTK